MTKWIEGHYQTDEEESLQAEVDRLTKEAERLANDYQDLGRVSHEEHERIDAALGIPDQADRPRRIEHTLAAIDRLRQEHDADTIQLHAYLDEVERLRAEKSKVEAHHKRWHLEKWGHGPCCTCQQCGQFYDDCRCSLDEAVERAEQAEAEVERLRADNVSRDRVIRDHKDALKQAEARLVEWEQGPYIRFDTHLKDLEVVKKEYEARLEESEVDRETYARIFGEGTQNGLAAAVRARIDQDRLALVVKILKDYTRYEWERINAALAAAQPGPTAEEAERCRKTPGPCTCGAHRTELGDWAAAQPEEEP